MALRVNDTLKQLRPVDVFENGISNEDAADSIPRPVTTPDDTSTSGKAVPTAATILYYKLFGYVQIAGVCDGSVNYTRCANAATRTKLTSC